MTADRAPAIATLDRRRMLAATAMVPFGALAAGSTASAAGSPALEAPWERGGTIPCMGGAISWRGIGAASGTPIVLLHKLGGWVADWRGMAPLLAAAGLQVVAFDLPGHGRSQMAGAPPFVQHVDETAAVIVACLAEMDLPRAHFMGNSLGGVTAVAIAARWPERTDRLILASVGLSAAKSRAALLEQEKTRDPTVWTADWRPLPRSPEQVANFGSLVPAVEAEQNASRAIADRWVRPSERGAALHDTQSLLARVTAPLLCLFGDRGPYVRFLDIPAAMCPGSRTIQFRQTGSFLHQERPRETADAVLRFLASPA